MDLALTRRGDYAVRAALYLARRADDGGYVKIREVAKTMALPARAGRPSGHAGRMFVRYFVEVPLPAARVERALLDSPADWLSAMAGAAEERGGELLGEVGVGPLGARLGRVRIQLGEPVHFPSMTSLPLTWDPVRLEGLLPRLDADLELGALGDDQTQLAISARYRPPLGVVGRTADRVLLHRVAEATVKDFLDRLGQAITDQALAPDPGPVRRGRRAPG